jgi:cytochrome b
MSEVRVDAGQKVRVRVWDGFTRLTHWIVVLLFGFSWGSAEYHHMDYHRYSGYALLGLLVFRLFWGFFGSSTARFAQFVKGPKSVWIYIRSSEPHGDLGHNPLGAMSVVALLLLLSTQIVLGLFAVDVDGIESGPWSNLVSFETGRACAQAHHLLFNVLLAFAALHIAAILYYAVAKRHDLVRPMVTGWTTVRQMPANEARFAPVWLAAVGVVVAAGVVWLVV